jgi:hypothetical protein
VVFHFEMISSNLLCCNSCSLAAGLGGAIPGCLSELALHPASNSGSNRRIVFDIIDVSNGCTHENRQ